MMSNNSKKKDLKSTYIIYPHWGAFFFLAGAVVLVVIGVSVFLILGLSASSDRVFASEALLSGLIVDLGFRHILNRKLVLAPKLEIPFIYLWPLLCLYVFIFCPFE